MIIVNISQFLVASCLILPALRGADHNFLLFKLLGFYSHALEKHLICTEEKKQCLEIEKWVGHCIPVSCTNIALHLVLRAGPGDRLWTSFCCKTVLSGCRAAARATEEPVMSHAQNLPARDSIFTEQGQLCMEMILHTPSQRNNSLTFNSFMFPL